MYHEKKKKCTVPNVIQLKNVLFASIGVVEKESLKKKKKLTKSSQYMTFLMESFTGEKYIQNLLFTSAVL